MLTTELLDLRSGAAELERVRGPDAHPSVKSLFAADADYFRPGEDISTLEVAKQHRKMAADGGAVVDFVIERTPYLAEPHDEMDNPLVRMVVIQGPARAGKTVTAENFLLKVGLFGPSRNVLWYLDSTSQAERYVADRVVPMFDLHDDLQRKLDLKKKQKWNLKSVDGQRWEWLPANKGTTRQRSASLIVADEIDAMEAAIANAIEILIANRQREHGSAAKAFVASHPDRGPKFGVAALIAKSDMRVRLWTCPCCATRFTPAAEADLLGLRRIMWNVPQLLKLREEMDQDALVAHIQEHARLICPNGDCRAEFGDQERLEMDADGVWIGKGQRVDERENVVGTRTPNKIAGFILHAFMSPFVKLAELAKEFVEAKITFDDTGDRKALKEVLVKSLGEIDRGDEAGSKPRAWKQVRARLRAESGINRFMLRTVPPGVDFLTAHVDPQVNRFAVAVLGWSRNRESWLIDRYEVKQAVTDEGLHDIFPFDSLAAWDEIEKQVLHQRYPLVTNPDMGLAIAKLTVDTGGGKDTTRNGRTWAGNLMAAHPDTVPRWRLLLHQGDAHTKGDIIQKPREFKHDEAGREWPVPVVERTLNVHELKKVIAYRMDPDPESPPGAAMHLPVDVEDRHVKELCAETLVNGVWMQQGRNELWDHWVYGEAARRLLAPENRKIDWENDPPIFARPIPLSRDAAPGDRTAAAPDFVKRFRALTRKRRGS